MLLYIKEALKCHTGITFLFAFSCSNEDMWEQIKEDAEADWKAFKESLSDGMESMEKEVKEDWKGIKDTAKEDWEVVKDTAKEDWGVVKDTAKEDWNKVKEEAQDGWNKLDLDWNQLALPDSKVLPAESAESEEAESKGKEREKFYNTKNSFQKKKGTHKTMLTCGKEIG